MSYRDEVIYFIRRACQDVYDRIDDLIPKDTTTAFSVKLSINIPTQSDKLDDFPNFEISMSSYPSRSISDEMVLMRMNYERRGEELK